MDKEEKITNNIIAVNKNMDALKKHFSHCFDKSGNFDFDKFKIELSKNDINFFKESYGLDWLGKSYARLLASDAATTLLKEDAIHNQKEKNKKSENLLIKGDNLEVLKHLSNAYHEEIKMIYIDPPYNTGSDGFVYEDDRKFTVKELQELAGVDEEKAKRILDFTRSKSNSHSAWLTFMYPRLYIAKQLLKDEGVIFVSIDDNEVAQLRILMDEIFGEDNFVIEFAWRKTDNQANIGNIARVKEYVICYCKDSEKVKLFKMSLTERAKKEYRYKDEKGYFRRDILLHKTRGRNKYEIKTPKGNILFGPWMIDEKEFKKLENNNGIYWTNGGDEQPYGKIYLNESEGQIANDFLGIEYGTNQEASIEVDGLFNKRVFDFPKPVSLIKHFINISTININFDIILDFFAGSGTTGDAIMQLNAEDGGNRKYILVQLPETIDSKKNKIAYDFIKNELKVNEPTIFEITKERLIRAANKIKIETIDKKIAQIEKDLKELNGKLDFENKEEKIKQLKAEIDSLNKQDLGFKIFETMPIWEDYDFEADQLNNDIQLFDDSKLKEEDIKSLLITWKTYDGILLTEDLQEIDLGGYKSYYGNGKLYLMDKGYTTDNLKNLLEKIDSDKGFCPNVIIAFGYHFDSKNLREISENVKSYANKKHIEIDFITRY